MQVTVAEESVSRRKNKVYGVNLGSGLDGIRSSV